MNMFLRCKNIFYGFVALLSSLTFKLNTMFSQTTCINEVLIYGAEDKEQRKEIGLNNLLCICYTLMHATKSIDMCLPSLRSETICKCLLNVRQKSDVVVRLILYDDSKKRYIEVLKDHGVAVKSVNSKIQLQHEFSLIDANVSEDAVAIMGCLDYDITNLNLNRASTLLISDSEVITPLKREFERIWDKFYFDAVSENS